MVSQQEIYEHQNTRAYYHTDHMIDNFHLFGMVNTQPVLNVGCGRAATVRIEGWFGVDFNRNLKDLWTTQGIARKCWVSDAKSLPFDGDAFAWTVSMDFLEHVPTDDLDAVISEILRVAPRLSHVIDANPKSSYKTPDGGTLHPSGHIDEDGWRERFAACSELDVASRGRYIQVTGCR